MRALDQDMLAAFEARGVPDTAWVDALNERAYWTTNTQPVPAQEMAERARAMAEALGYERGRAFALGIIGYTLYMRSEHEQALRPLLEALALTEIHEDETIEANVLSALAMVYVSLGHFEQALSCGLRSLTLHKQQGNRREAAWSHMGLGTSYFEVGDYDRANRNFMEALDLFTELGVVTGEARALTGLGLLYHTRGDQDRAHEFLTRSLGLFRTAGNKLGEARALNDLGIVYQHREAFDEALACHQESLRLRIETGNRQAECTSLINLGKLHLQRGDVADALLSLEEALTLAHSINAKPRMYQAHQALSEAYEAKGNLTQALFHQKAFHQYKEEVFGEETSAKINHMQVSFEVEKAQQEAEITRLRNVELREKNEQLETLLQELKAAQVQLIQQEKLASLGQLTAGIAHEIKNPLNFVNNFAALTVELAAELSESLKGEREGDRDAAEETDDLLADIGFNAGKIQEHGKRADSIVKSMMLHASGKKGERRPTPLNDLLDEFVNLSYHGMRAQHPDFNVTLERVYDPAVGHLETVQQDIGRVFINLLNNAFFAVFEKAQHQAGYAPKVSIQTRREAHGVTIVIRDNGPGIPPEVQARIFEPFFTTKPTGVGTGLGLSLSHEIIAHGHGGTLSMESEPGAGASFTLTLPLP